ncbi:hypothetical protein F5B22DRAFT_659933 [Xylaria bambusicola]|uniref:uncharacterized protein n=1 Tax=Xylaria bambusicola TaxID=326684 RepID=UPI0020081E53|nr:uncharacterized protein F5B22DRAFT_659933 [Xylaria bambusicola]KAI0506716.1 hypothetical protein F5B22DRAFT_659933 [Xylaria bambusicola]
MDRNGNININHYINLERRLYLEITAYTQWIRKVAVVLADLPIHAYLRPDRQQVRDTGFGISAPNAYRFKDVLREDWPMVVALFSLIALLSRLLYLIIAPPSIFALEYALAVLFLFYSIGIIVLTYQAIRDMDHPTRISALLPERFNPFERCAICQEDSPHEQLIDIHCRVPGQGDQIVRHSFHEECIISHWEARMVIANAGEEYRCPICRQEPDGYSRHFGPRSPNFLDNSRLMWYIHSLFARRLVVMMNNFTRRPRYPFQGHPYQFNTIYYIQLMPNVAVGHVLLALTLLFYLRLATLMFYLPLSWPAWVVVLSISIAFLNRFSRIIDTRLYTAADDGIFRLGMMVFDSIDFFAYLFPSRAPPAPPVRRVPDDGRPNPDGPDDGGANNGAPDNALNDGIPDNGRLNNDDPNVGILIDIDDNGAGDAQNDEGDDGDDGGADDHLDRLYGLTLLKFTYINVRVMWVYVRRLFWSIGSRIAFDLAKYVALIIPRFVIGVALYHIVSLLFFALESPLVTPSVINN